MLGGDKKSVAISSSSSTTSDAHQNSLLCSLSLLNHKLNHLQSMVTLISVQGASSSRSTSTLSGMSNLIQEIMDTASTMIFNCQQLSLKPSTADATTGNNISPTIYSQDHKQDDEPSFYWHTSDTYNNTTTKSNATETVTIDVPGLSVITNVGRMEALESYDDIIIEIEVAELMAKYAHYCQVCGKGFKRDANLRMHMRAHGDEYKSNAALKNTSDTKQGVFKRKYSCPQEGCRWNKKHDKFQPLKSMVCVKNHYRRSHCPKMYVCKRCNRKRFSVLSDLRTHEKHCGDGIKWRCSCGTTFSRKDKLMGHVALFVGHSPVVFGDGSDGSVVANAVT